MIYSSLQAQTGSPTLPTLSVEMIAYLCLTAEKDPVSLPTATTVGLYVRYSLAQTHSHAVPFVRLSGYSYLLAQIGKPTHVHLPRDCPSPVGTEASCVSCPPIEPA
jgi:hypothetical protein